jgi:tetratricopeptide (TPR) repeat protein
VADAGLAQALALVDGRALLTIAGRDLQSGVVERLEVEWPGRARVDGLRNRRGRLRLVKLVIDRARLEDRVAAAKVPLPLPAGEIVQLSVALEPGQIVLSGRAATQGGGESAFATRLILGAGKGRKLSVTVDDADARAALARAALAALLGLSTEDGKSFEIDPLEAALDEILVTEGFRLPDSADLRLGAVRVSTSGIALSWSSASVEAEAEAPSEEAPAAAERPAAVVALQEQDEIAALRHALDAAPAGEARAEVAQRLAAAYERAGEQEGAVAALRLCIENAAPGPLIGPAWRRLIEIHARRGDPQAAARALISSADDPRVGASEGERAGTLVAAAEILRKRLNLSGDAGMLLERALALDPTSAEALEALEAVTIEAGDDLRLADVLERKIVLVARGPREEKTILARLVELYAGPLARPDLARRTRERLLKIDPDLAPARSRAPLSPPRPAPAPARAAQTETRAAPAGDATEPATEPSAETFAAAGRSAEAGGDLTRAGQAYWRAAGIEAEPARRANYLISHARVLLARGEIPAAIGEIEQALDRAPGHLGALALLADVSFRKQDWARARELYATIERSTDATDVIPRELLVHRRAALAQRLGDSAESEALYRELAILSPHHAEARRALAELALARGDTATAALRLEEVLRLLPVGAASEIGDLRHRLGAIYAETGEWGSARYYLELAVAQDPTRAPALELLLQTYEKLELHREAADLCGRLARLYVDPTQRAATLYRQAEILQAHLSDEAGALNAYLRSSDVDPGFVPARLRLIDHFWGEGDVDVVADLANDLAGVPLLPDEDADLIVRLAIATAGPRSTAPARFPLADHPGLADAAARALAVAGDAAAARGVDTIDPLLAHARFWAGPAGDGMLVAALLELVLADPGRPGPACALGALAARTRRFALARAAFSLPAFVEPEGLGSRLLEGLAPVEPVRAAAVRVGTEVDHPDVAGPARRALARLAPALLGLGYDQPAPKPVEGSGLQPARATELRRIADLLGAPPFVVAPDAEGAKPLALQSERRRLRLVPSQPAGLLISPSAARLGPSAWSFVAGRALEALRSGLVTAGLTSAEGLARLFEGARAALGGPAGGDPRARTVAEWLLRPEASLLLGSAEGRAELRADLEAALEALPDWQTFRRGTRHTCNRIGLLVCGSPLSALSVVSEGELYGDDGEAPSVETRREFVRGPNARETIAFMLSPAYEAAAIF